MVMDATEATADDEKEIAAGLAEAFTDLEGPQGVRVPARIHFFSARAPG
jgi:hypothetical protein